MVSGYRAPSQANQAAFEAAIAEVAHSARHLLESVGVDVVDGPDRWVPSTGRSR
jgi:hypothetical protein